jgi:site-specific recombinase XerD
MEGARSIYSHSSQLKSVINSIELVDKYLRTENIVELIPDEDFFTQIREDFKKERVLINEKKYAKSTIQALSQDPKRVMNRYFLSKKWILRSLLKEHIYNRFQKFWALTLISQKMILWFEENAQRFKSEEQMIINEKNQLVRQGRNVRFVSGELSPLLKRHRIATAIRFLALVKKSGFEFVDESDITKFRSYYKAKQQGHTAEKDLIDLYAFFANCFLAGFLKTNPFENCILKRDMKKSKIDFIDDVNIQKILNLETLDWKDTLAVRNRLICALAYDCGFRRSELAQLKAQFINELDTGLVRIKVDALLQKGDKPTTYLYVLFRPTAELLRRYIRQIRSKLNPKNDYLFLTQEGNALSSFSVERAVKKISNELGIKTFYGKIPSPHVLRHSMATLNIEPYGRLTLLELQKRMRHTSIEVLMDHYVHNNPLAEREKYEEFFAQKEKASGSPEVNYEQVIQWMKRVEIPIEIRRKIEGRYQEYSLSQSDKESRNNCWVAEPQTMWILSKLGLKRTAFRAYCVKRNLCQQRVSEGHSVYLYDKQFVQKLADQYHPKDVIMKRCKWSRTTFYRKSQDFETLTIGKVLLVGQDSLFQQ